MGLKKPTGLDNTRESDLGTSIRELEEQIADLCTYVDMPEVGLLQARLEQLKQQHLTEVNNG